MKKILNVIIFFLILVLLFVIIYPQYQISRVHTLKVGMDSSLNSEIVRLIEKNSPEKNYKLKIEEKISNDPEELYENLKEGKIDMAVLPWYFVLSNHRDITKIAKVVLVSQYKPIRHFFGVVGKVKKEVKIGDILKKRVGIPSFYKDDLLLLYKHKGIPEEEMKYRTGSVEELVKMLENGEIDFIFLPEPFITKYSENLNLVYSSPFSKEISSPYPGVGFFLRKDIVNKKSYMAFRFRLASNDVLRELGKNRDSVKVVILKDRKIDPEKKINLSLPDWYKVEEFEHFRGLTLEPFLARTSVTLGEKFASLKTKEFFYTPAELTE